MKEVVISGVTAFLVAALTSIIAYILELKKLSQSRQELETTIYHSNFLKLYEKRLEALKSLNRLKFEQLKLSVQEISEPDTFLEPICFKVADIQNSIKEIILEYGYLFNSTVQTGLTECYDICEEMFMEVDSKQLSVTTQGLRYAFELRKGILSIIEQLEKDLFMDNKQLRTLLKVRD